MQLMLGLTLSSPDINLSQKHLRKNYARTLMTTYFIYVLNFSAHLYL